MFVRVLFCLSSQEWYGRWMSGIFLDESAHVADDVSDRDGLMCAKYKGYLQHVQKHMGEAATVSETDLGEEQEEEVETSEGAARLS